MRWLIALALLPATAAAQQHGDWKVEIVDINTIGAYTTNASGGVFGKLCYVKTQLCVWVVSSSAPCNESATYVWLSNSASGAYSHQMECYGERKMGQLMTFHGYDLVESISKNDNVVGFAVPLADGLFQVTRFSLRGSVEATAAAEQAVVSAAEAAPADYTL